MAPRKSDFLTRRRAEQAERAARFKAEREAAEEAAWLAEEERNRPTLSVAEVAKRRGVGEEAVRGSIKAGTLKAVCITPPDVGANRRIYRISEAAYEAYAALVPTIRSPYVHRVDPDIYDRRKREGWLTMAEAAKMITISVQRLHSYVRRKRIPAEREGILFVRRADAQALLDRRTARLLASLDLDGTSDR